MFMLQTADDQASPRKLTVARISCPLHAREACLESLCLTDYFTTYSHCPVCGPQTTVPMRVSSTNVSVASSMARLWRPFGGRMKSCFGSILSFFSGGGVIS